MTCAEFDLRLDGGLAALDPAALEHARGCARCTAALAAEREIEAGLAAFTLRAPAGFTDRVMAGVARAPRRAVAWAPRPALEWWVRAAADPAVALAFALAGLVLWRGEGILQVALALLQGGLAAGAALVASWPAFSLPAVRIPGAQSTPLIGVAFALALAPAMLWASWRLFGWAERACAPSARAR